MRPRAVWLASSAIAIASLAGCYGIAGFQDSYTQAPDEAGADVVAPDTGVDAPADRATPDTGNDVAEAGCTGTCPVTVPPGWTLVAYAPAAGTACPTGFTTAPQDVKEAPITFPTPGCTCDTTCTITAGPSCPATVNVTFDTNGSHTCGTLLGQVHTAGCISQTTTIPANAELKVADVLTGGTCNGTGTVHLANAAFAATGRICSPNSPAAAGCGSDAGTTDAGDAGPRDAGDAGAQDAGGSGTVCTPQIPAGFSTCIVAPGKVQCPSGVFTSVHDVGSGATFTCGACPSCAVSGTCTGGNVVFYSNVLLCSGALIETVPADNICHLPGSAGGTSNAYTYNPGNPSGVGCTASGTPPQPSNVNITAEQTVCCLP